MSSTKNLMSMLTGLQSNDQVQFAEAMETIKTAAAMLSRPDVVACLAFLRETAHAAGSIQSVMQSGSAETLNLDSDVDSVVQSMIYDAVNAVTLQDAVKAVAIQDTVKAVALQYAIKAVALRAAAKFDTFSEDEIRAIVSEEAARAIGFLRHSDPAPYHGKDRRLRNDRRKHH